VTFYDVERRPITDPDVLARLRALAIPPAWQQVWICPDPRGHIQATGIDAAGRKQYLYHPVWRTKRDEAKFDHVLEVAARLPTLRQRVRADLTQRGLGRPRVLATVARLLDMGMFRVGSDQYAAGTDPTYGVSTLRPEHIRGERGCMVFAFTAKGGIEQVRRVGDAQVCEVLRQLRRRRAGADRIFGYWDAAARVWRDVHSDDVNEYLRAASGGEMTAKDFRTWHGTVLAATELAVAGWHRSPARRRRTVAAVMTSVSELLGNTPTVARASYVDPRVIDLYHEGVTITVDLDAPKEIAERAVLEVLTLRT
jgi:DNA topoisomerase IB